MKIEQITPPNGTAVTLDSAKKHLYVEHTADDELISIYINQAAAWCSSYTGKHIGAQTWALYADRWCEAVSLPFYPLHSVTVTYIDTEGAQQTLPPDQYYFDGKQYPALLQPREGVTWPDVSPGPNVITVTCDTGAVSLNGNITAAIYLLVGHLYEQRSESAPINLKAIPMGVTSFLDNERLHW